MFSSSRGLNATQQKKPQASSSGSAANHPIFLQIEEELHDARRVHADGQEDDLRGALSMVIGRVGVLSSMLSEAYKAQADLEVQLNVAKSNLKMVIANNEMLEDALKQNSSKESVGWRRTSTRDSTSGDNAGSPINTKDPRASLERSQSMDVQMLHSPSGSSNEPLTPPSTTSTSASQSQDNRFFKFRFSTGAPSSTNNSRPGTPLGRELNTSPNPNGAGQSHLNSPSLASLPEGFKVNAKELEDLTAELEKEKKERKKIVDEKQALEEELESLSQALFEEANKMVSDERRMRAEVEEELKELRMEKEALRSALRVIEGENSNLRSHTLSFSSHDYDDDDGRQGLPLSHHRAHSRSSSQTAIKSRPQSLDLPPLPPSPAPSASPEQSPNLSGANAKTPSASASGSSSSIATSTSSSSTASAYASASASSLLSPIPDNILSPEEESQPTPRFRVMIPPPGSTDDLYMEASPWADVPSSSSRPTSSAGGFGQEFAGERGVGTDKKGEKEP